MSSPAEATPAQVATGWTLRTVVSGGDEFPTGVALRAWGPTDEVFLAYELYDPDLETAELELEGLTCSGTDCSSVSWDYGPVTIGAALRYDEHMNQSMGIYRDGAGQPRELHIVRRSRLETDCDDDGVGYTNEDSSSSDATELDLRMGLWTTSASPTYVNVEKGTANNCKDHGASFTRVQYSSGYATSCWRFSATPEELHCGEDDGTGDFDTEIIDNTMGAVTALQDHVSFLIDSGDRVAAHRSIESGTSKMRIRFLDDATDPDVVLSTNDPDYPDMSRSATDRYHVVWHEEEDENSTAKIKYSTCKPSGSVDCTDAADWSTEDVATGRKLRHACVTSDGVRQFIVYMEDEGSGSDVRFRVKYKTRCADDVDWDNVTPVTLLEPKTDAPSEEEWDQSLFMGRKPIGADRGDDLFFVAFAQMDNMIDSATDGDLYLMHRAYNTCP